MKKSAPSNIGTETLNLHYKINKLFNFFEQRILFRTLVPPNIFNSRNFSFNTHTVIFLLLALLFY